MWLWKMNRWEKHNFCVFSFLEHPLFSEECVLFGYLFYTIPHFCRRQTEQEINSTGYLRNLTATPSSPLDLTFEPVKMGKHCFCDSFGKKMLWVWNYMPTVSGYFHVRVLLVSQNTNQFNTLCDSFMNCSETVLTSQFLLRGHHEKARRKKIGVSTLLAFLCRQR